MYYDCQLRGKTAGGFRAEKGYSQQLAGKMLVDRSSIARWENGTRSLTPA